MSVLKNLIDWHYYFSTPTSGNFRYMIFLLVLFGLFLILGLYAKYVLSIKQKKTKYNKMLGDKLFDWLLTIFLAGYAYLFFRYEGIRFLGARFWLVIIFAWFIWSGYQVWRFYKHDYQRMQKSLTNHDNSKSYRPKKRKK